MHLGLTKCISFCVRKLGFISKTFVPLLYINARKVKVLIFFTFFRILFVKNIAEWHKNKDSGKNYTCLNLI